MPGSAKSTARYFFEKIFETQEHFAMACLVRDIEGKENIQQLPAALILFSKNKEVRIMTKEKLAALAPLCPLRSPRPNSNRKPVQRLRFEEEERRNDRVLPLAAGRGI